MPFALPDLPYAHDALEGAGMSRETLEYHHDLHHKAYADNGAKLHADSPQAGLETLEEIITATYDPSAVAQSGLFNNASQMWNHNQFWEMMSPGETAMPGALESKIVADFGSVDAFKAAFSAAGAGQFGSGWCWLVMDPADGKLKVTKTENGVNPLCHKQHALLGCDVWEHSYYIDFRNKRPAYLANFLEKLVNWEDVANRLETAMA